MLELWFRVFVRDANPRNIKKGFLAFSYGDQKFMLNTPQWKDIQLKTTFKAIFLNTSSVIQVGHYQAIKQDSSVIPLKISKSSYQKLQKAILDSCAYQDHQLIPITHNTNFYYFKAKNPYNMFYTCNTWAGNMLNKANIPVSPWTPLSYQVVYGFL